MDNLLITTTCPIDAVYHESEEELELKTHFHNSYELIYVLEGKVYCLINSKRYVVDKNSFIFINNMETHHLKVMEYPYKRYFLLIKPDTFKSVIKEPVLSSILNNRSETFRHVLHIDNQSKDEFISHIERIYQEINAKDVFWEAAVKSGLYQLFISLYRNYPEYFPINALCGSTKGIVEIQKYLEEHFLDQIGLDDVAKRFFMNKYTISHQFKKVTGFNFKEYLIRLRISKARDLLFYTDESITWVCMNSGFNNVNHFIRIFKKFEGTTPYQYRKSYRTIDINDK